MRNTVVIMWLWSDTCIQWDTNIKVLLFIWCTSLFDAHHAAVVQHCSGPQRIVGKNLSFVCSGGTTKKGSFQVNKNRSSSAPTSAVLHFRKHWADFIVEALLNTAVLFSSYKCQIFYLLLKVWVKQTLIIWLCVSGNQFAVMQGYIFSS